MSPISKILVAHDFSSHAAAALAQAIELARAFGARVDVVHVAPRHVDVLSPYESALPEPLVRELEEAARRKLEGVLAEVRAAGLEGEMHLTSGDPAQGIAEAAERSGADLVVLGSRGLTGLKHVLFGSVAERTHRIAPCAVLSVKAEEEAS